MYDAPTKNLGEILVKSLTFLQLSHSFGYTHDGMVF